MADVPNGQGRRSGGTTNAEAEDDEEAEGEGEGGEEARMVPEQERRQLR